MAHVPFSELVSAMRMPADTKIQTEDILEIIRGKGFRFLTPDLVTRGGLTVPQGSSMIALASFFLQWSVVEAILAEGVCDMSSSNQEAPILYAITDGDAVAIEMLRKNGFDIKAFRDSAGCNALYLAILHHHTELLMKLIEDHGVDPLAHGNTRQRKSLLHIAAKMENLSALQYLVEKYRININDQDTQNRTPLHYAVLSENSKMVEYLICKGASVNTVDDSYYSPLTSSVKAGRPEMIRLLINSGADPVAQFDGSQTALHLAVTTVTSSEVMELLCQAAIKTGIPLSEIVDTSGNTPLHIAARSKASDRLVPILLAAGFDPNALNKRWQTPVYQAASWDRLETLHILVEAGGDSQIADKTGKTSLHAVLVNAKPTSLAYIASLANTNAPDAQGITALHLAALKEDAEQVTLLIGYGAGVDAQTILSVCPLDHAAQRGNVDAVAALIANGASVNGFNPQSSPLHLASTSGHATTVAKLLDAGADVDARDSIGYKTPLESAELLYRKVVCSLLKAEGATPSKKKAM